MNYYFITGTGKGLGKSIAEKLLNEVDNYVVGLSRGNSILHDNFKFVELDLLNQKAILEFDFPLIDKAESICLINNAGVIGEVSPIGSKNSAEVYATFQINTIGPAQLMNQFVKIYQNENVAKSIINISSGAARHSINAWADYCASKAALDMYSLVLADEQKLQAFPIRVSSVAPGIIDTEMQSEIRATKPEGFPKYKYFLDLKKNDELSAPSDVANALIKYIKEPHADKVLVDLREL